MTLHVHHGSRLASLAGALADILADPLADPFATEVVAVPAAGIRDWLRRFVAGRLGVAANIDMPFPARFVATALGATPDADDPWAIERVTWAILDVIEGGAASIPGWPTDLRAGATSRYVVARRVADLFDHYATNRPQLVHQWAGGIPGDGTLSAAPIGGWAGSAPVGEVADGRVAGAIPSQMRWQFDLWRAVRAAIGVPNPAETLPATLEHLTNGDVEVGLPARVAMFGISTVTSVQVAVMRALAVTRDVHVFVVHPSPVAWAATPPLAPHGLTLRSSAGAADPNGHTNGHTGGHPLLRTWGRLTFEAAGLLRGVPGAVIHEHTEHAHQDEQDEQAERANRGERADARSSPTLLDQIRVDIAEDRAPRVDPDVSLDGTVQVHACHGAVRQLEVLRDVLDGMFVADPTLQPRHVAVLCPDLARFAPFAATVLGRGTLPVPVTVTDLALESDNPVADALAAIVGVLAGRCGVRDILDVAALEPVRQRLGLGVDDLERFGNWVDDLGTRWGLDHRHRADWDHGDILDGTWAAAVDALLAGVMMPAPEPREGLGGIVPFDDLGATEMRQAGILADLIERLGQARMLLGGHRPIGEWCDRLVTILSLLCRAEPGRAWQMAAVTEAIERLRAESIVGGKHSTLPLSRADLGAVVDTLVGGSRGRLRMRSGSVTVTDLPPVRNVPARVVCLLGFDDSSLRAPSVDGDDVLTVQPCAGERDRRADHRHVLLDALMAAGERLVITCDGSDLTTNRRIRTPVQLAELLDVIDSTTGGGTGGGPTGGETDHPAMTRHPRRAYDERIFGGGVLTSSPASTSTSTVTPLARIGIPVGFDDSMLRAATTRRTLDIAEQHVRPNRFDARLPIAVPESVTLDQLVEACARPARVLLRDGLDLRLPAEASSRDEHVPLEASPFDSAALGRDLLRVVRGSDDPLADLVASWSEAQRRVGRLPPRRLADHTLAEIVDELGRLLGAPAGSSVALDLARSRCTIDIDVELAAHVRLLSAVGAVHGDTALDVRYERFKARHVIGAALRLAALVVNEPARSWRTVVVARAATSQDTKPAIWWATPQPAAGVVEAKALLDTALELRLDALRRRLPLFEKTSWCLHTTGSINDDDLFGGDHAYGADLADEHAAFVWEGVTVDDLERHDPSIRQLASKLWLTIDRFARVVKAST